MGKMERLWTNEDMAELNQLLKRRKSTRIRMGLVLQKSKICLKGIKEVLGKIDTAFTFFCKNESLCGCVVK